MEVKYLVDEKNHVEIEVAGCDYSILAIIHEILSKDKDVSFATYVIGSPARDNPKLVVKTKKKDAKKVLEAAIDSAIKEFESLAKGI